uniref:PHP domain-containing protein n=1 Tax=Blastomonas fulva TaxID=1550728 RepID=UPI003F722371
MPAPFAELVTASNYSFLRGASHPAEIVARALELGLAGIGIADRNTVAGVVRAHIALRDAHKAAAEIGVPAPALRLVVGARLVFADGTPDIIAYPATRHGWGRLTRLLTLGNLRATKGDCTLHLADLLGHLDDLLLIVMAAPTDAAVLHTLHTAAPDRVWIGATMPRRGTDRRRLARMIRLGEETGVPLLATNDVLYAAPEQRPLHDVLTCIGAGCTIANAGRRLEANAERHIKPPAEMARLFADCPQAIAQTTALLARITFTLDDLRYQYPLEPVPEGWEAQAWLEHMVTQAARDRYGRELPPKVRKLLNEEFALIAKQKYACYFLTVHDLVRFARTRDPPILCQGRGSAANSIVCFLLGVTSVDPVTHDLLF